MAQNWLGVIVSGGNATFVQLDCKAERPKLINQFTWLLQDGGRIDAYAAFFERVRDYVSGHNIQQTVIKASAIGQTRPTLSHLLSAELRGVVAVAARIGGAQVSLVQKSLISKTFGERKADEYLKDDVFWEGQIEGDLAKTRREAALLILSQKDSAG